jgi:anaerobic dimethyl sulfoxide reductase subunit B (iron-sulfur subunit)
MAKQYGFYFDADRCVMCHACEMACKATRGVELGVQWRKVIEIWAGEFPDISRTFVSISCLHCAEPSCVEACPNGAITKRAEDGIVVVDKAECTGCGECFYACPYQVPQFGSDGLMQKCDFCLDRGIAPACVEPCPAEALFFGTMEELAQKAAEKKAEKLAGDTGPSMYIANTRGADIPAESLIIG